MLSKLRSWFVKSVSAPDPYNYRVFTRDFDIVVSVDQLDSVLGPLSDANHLSLEEAWSAFSGALQGWRTKTHLEALDSTTRILARSNAKALQETAATILVDQSGSMRGQNMLLAAAATDVACDFLVHLGVTVEVLGFTTVRWKGGKSRERWLRGGRPWSPGRLCDLLHIIYRTADDRRASTGSWSFKSMLRPDLPKENVDGEALEWAASRLREREEPNK
ncbi:MAG: hypothetical protein MI723_19465, partial [Caulobacterales bacterium]|nr:hypothetical protein [Caulobacterales bacterium]